MIEKKKRLGKGLSALLDTNYDDPEFKNESNQNNLVLVKEIELSKFQASRKFDEEKLNELSELSLIHI